MKHKIIITLLTAGLLFNNATGITAKDPYRSAKVGTVTVKEYDDITTRQLTTRKKKGNVIIAVEYGTCINNKGDGRTPDGYYIRYTKALKNGKLVKVRKGDKIKTLLFFDPYGSGEDDIEMRADYIIN